jgi:hypothetical protein
MVIGFMAGERQARFFGIVPGRAALLASFAETMPAPGENEISQIAHAQGVRFGCAGILAQ